MALATTRLDRVVQNRFVHGRIVRSKPVKRDWRETTVRYWVSYGLLALALVILIPLTANGDYKPDIGRGLIFGAIALAAIGIGRVVVFIVRRRR